MSRIQKPKDWTYFPATLLILACGAQFAAAQEGRIAPRADAQNWNNVQIAVPLNKRIDLIFAGEVRAGDHLSDFVDERAGIGVSINAGKYLTLAPSYLYIAMQQPVTRRESYESRLNFAVTVRLPQIE